MFCSILRAAPPRRLAGKSHVLRITAFLDVRNVTAQWLTSSYRGIDCTEGEMAAMHLSVPKIRSIAVSNAAIWALTTQPQLPDVCSIKSRHSMAVRSFRAI